MSNLTNVTEVFTSTHSLRERSALCGCTVKREPPFAVFTSSEVVRTSMNSQWSSMFMFPWISRLLFLSLSSLVIKHGSVLCSHGCTWHGHKTIVSGSCRLDGALVPVCSLSFKWKAECCVGAVEGEERGAAHGFWIFRCRSPGLFLARAPFGVSRQRPLARRPTVGRRKRFHSRRWEKQGCEEYGWGKERAVGFVGQSTSGS